MKWQNLITGRCPRCSNKLTKAMDFAVIYECVGEEGCQFVISEKRYARMLADPAHPMRQHATAEELSTLEKITQ